MTHCTDSKIDDMEVEIIDTAPCALYRHFDADGKLLYIGISDDPERRLRKHKGSSSWAPKIVRMTVEWLNSRTEALAAEKAAILLEMPEFNKFPGRPLLFDEPVERSQISVPQAVSEKLRTLGDGSLSVGIVRAASYEVPDPPKDP